MTIPFVEYDENYGYSFQNAKINYDWKNDHLNNASLQLISKDANLSNKF